MTQDLRSIGLDYPKWQDAIEAAFGSGNLSVIGEPRGGQLVRFEDPSGARLHILTVEPFPTFAGFAGSTHVTAHVSGLDDVLALVEIVGDDPSSDTFDQVLGTAVCALAQGPLIVDEGTQTFEHVNLAALAVDVAVSNGEGKKSHCSFTGAEAITANSGSQQPSASARLGGEVERAERRVNALTGQEFWVVVLDLPFSMEVLLPVSAAPELHTGDFLEGTFLLVGDILAPQGCGTGGGCGGCGGGGCGCGGH